DAQPARVARQRHQQRQAHKAGVHQQLQGPGITGIVLAVLEHAVEQKQRTAHQAQQDAGGVTGVEDRRDPGHRQRQSEHHRNQRTQRQQVAAHGEQHIAQQADGLVVLAPHADAQREEDRQAHADEFERGEDIAEHRRAQNREQPPAQPQQQPERQGHQQRQQHDEGIVPGVLVQVLIAQAIAVAGRPTEDERRADIGQHQRG
uniref:200 kDa antigen p200 n=1 Tax=Steinernema glaseri TaxID=37863 RepID=A0A1I7ZG47_9BILA